VPDTYFPPSMYSHIHPDLEPLLSSLPEPPEGHISPEQAEYLFHFIRLIRPSLVAETGFCVGHSACIIMLAQESTGLAPRMLSIDICRYEETKRSVDIIKRRFPGLKFVEGDTRQVLAPALRRFLRRNGELPLDLAIVDGGHDAETALSDLEICFACLRPGGYLWLDDFEKPLPNSGVNLAGRRFARRWGSCHRLATRDGRGFMLHQKGF
jgi:predicted O-methyltransferase YrrM